MTSINPTWTWFLTAIIGVFSLAVGMFVPGSDERSRRAQNENLESLGSSLKIPAMMFFLCSSIAYGVDYGIRNIIVMPFVTNDLTAGNVFAMAHVTLVASVAGLFGNLVYRWFLIRANRGTVFVVIALLAYATAELIAYLTHDFTVFVLSFAAAVFTFGWYFALRQSRLNSLIVYERNRATVLSIDSMLMNMSGAMVLLLLAGSMDGSSVRNYWLACSASLLTCAVFYVLSANAKRSPLKEIVCRGGRVSDVVPIAQECADQTP